MVPSKEMRAVHITSFVSDLKDLQVSRIPLPKTSPNTLLIRITHAALTHVDLLYARGKHQNNQRHMKPPFTLGIDFAGVVVSSPPSSTQFSLGDRVFGSSIGAYAEYIAIDVSKKGAADGVRKVPKEWSLKEACAVGSSGAVSWASLMKVAGLKAGEVVLVLGATGGLGTLACQIALAAGASVVAVVGDERKAEALKRSGVQDVIVGYENWAKKVQKAIKGKGKEGVDVVYDAVGAVEDSLRCIRFGGRIVIVGFAARGGVMENVKVNRMLLKGATVIGYRYGEEGRRDPGETKKVWDGFGEMIAAGKIKPMIYDEDYRGLDSIPRAMQDMMARKVVGRLVVEVAREDLGSEKAQARL